MKSKMNSLIVFAVLIISLSFASCTKVAGTGSVELKTASDSVSYALGYLEATQFKKMMDYLPFEELNKKGIAKVFAKQKVKDSYVEERANQFGGFNAAVFQKAFLNEFVYEKSYFDEMTADMTLRKYFEANKDAREENEKKQSENNIIEGLEFLEKNKERENIVVLESGLQYEILVEGDGEKPTLNDRVKCHYHGTLINGEVFDSSVERGEPAVFGVTQVIPGWTEALQLMPVGSKWKLYLPSNLAYGDRAAGPKIAPNSTLVFEVELLGIE